MTASVDQGGDQLPQWNPGLPSGVPFPISSTIIDWTTMVKMADRDITRLIDKSKVKMSSLLRHLALIGALSSPTKSVQELMRDEDRALKHIHVSFLLRLPDREQQTKILELGSLDAITDRQLMLLTGNLLEWRHAILACCTQVQDIDIRTLFNNIYLAFMNLGISFSIQKHSLPDGTFEMKG